MKKIISLLLAIIMCVSLCSCGGNGSENTNGNGSDVKEDVKKEFMLPGEWKVVSTGTSYSFKEDGICVKKSVVEEAEYKYEFKEDLKLVVVYYGNQTLNFNIVEEEDAYTLSNGEIVLVPVEKFEKYHTEYADTTIARLTEGKTKLEIGKTYTCSNGLIFTVEDVLPPRAYDGDRAQTTSLVAVEILLKCDNETEEVVLQTSDEYFGSAYTEQRVGLGEWKEGDVYQITGGIITTYDIMKGMKDSFGILSFTIGGTSYYVDIHSFIEDN